MHSFARKTLYNSDFRDGLKNKAGIRLDGNPYMRSTAVLFLAAIALLIACPPVPLAADETAEAGVIEGRVMVRGVRAPVAFAKVAIEGTDREELTDEEGRFRFDNTPPGEVTLVVSEHTVETLRETVTVLAGETIRARLYVTKTGTVLEEIVVVGKKPSEQMARQEISKEELTGVPGANSDVIRVVENLPGVAQAGIMGSSQGLVIRGTEPTDSAYLFNGFEIPSLFHFGGLTSVINAEWIEDIAYYPGSYGVKYGDAIGGIVEITSRNPRTDRFGGVIDLSTYASYLLFEGPAGDRFAYAGAVRRSFIDFILPEVIPEDQAEFTVVPTFYDYSGQFEYRHDEQNTLSLAFLGSRDSVGILSEEIDESEPFAGNSFDMHIEWHRADLRWDAKTGILSNSLAANFVYYDTEVGFGWDQYLRVKGFNPALRNDASLRLGKWNTLRFGVHGYIQDATVEANVMHPPKEGDPGGSLSNEDTTKLDQDFNLWGGAVYLDDVMSPASWVQLVPGIRMDYLSELEEVTFDPRLTVKFFPTDRAAIKASGGLYHQWPQADEYIEQFGNPDLGSEVAYQGALGFEYDFGQGISLDLQGYLKDIEDMVAPTEIGSETPYENKGRGRVYGIELLARKKLTDRLFGWVSYTWSVSRRKDSPGADWRYFDDDQTHNLIVVASTMLGKRKQWRLGGRWQITTGLPYTDIETAIYNADTDSYIPIYSEDVNEKRERLFHQLDIRLDKLWTFKTWTLNTYIDLQNVYWNKYPIGYVYNFDYSEREAVSYPNFIPSIGLQARF